MRLGFERQNKGKRSIISNNSVAAAREMNLFIDSAPCESLADFTFIFAQ